MKQVSVIVILILIICFIAVRYSASTTEARVRDFCENILPEQHSYTDIVNTAKSNQLEITEYSNKKSGTVDNNKEINDLTHIYKRWGMAYLSCYIEHRDDQIIKVYFKADWDN